MSKIAVSRLRFALAAIIAAALLRGSPAAPQCNDNDSPPCYVLTENTYIGLAIGQGGKWKIAPPCHALQAEQPAGGRFQIWTTGGDPTTYQDDNMPLTFSLVQVPGPGDKWGVFQLLVDGITDPTGTGTGERAWCTFERGGTAALLGDLMDGRWDVWPYVPTNTTNTILGTWSPNISKGVSASAADVDVMSFPLKCDLEARIMRDTVRFKWTFTNQDIFSAHSVGLRMCMDPMLNPMDDGTFDYRNIVSIPGRPLVLDRLLMQGKEVPSQVDMLNALIDPDVSLRLTLKGQGATAPDVVGIDEWPNVGSDAWTYWRGRPTAGGDPFVVWQYTPIPNMAMYDLGNGVFWKPRRVTPGSSVTFITYVGLGCATSDFTKPNTARPQYVVAAQGPRALKYTSDATGLGILYPMPFRVYAYMTNLEKFLDLEDASFTLTLPTGLSLDSSEAGKYTKSLNRIAAADEAVVSWKVKADGYPTGILDYTISASASPVGATTVRRQINVPATEKQPLLSGWQMISVPFDVTNPDPASALGLEDSTFWRYDTYSRQYKSVTKFLPGEAYWLKLNTAQRTDMTPLEYTAMSWAGTQGYQVPLVTGWNLVGNPFIYALTVGELRFYTQEDGFMTYDQAVSKGLITTTLFWWDARFRQYKWSSERTAQLMPWQGYWLRAPRRDLTMIVTPESQIGAAVGGSPTSDDSGGGTPSIP